MERSSYPGKRIGATSRTMPSFKESRGQDEVMPAKFEKVHHKGMSLTNLIKLRMNRK